MKQNNIKREVDRFLGQIKRICQYDELDKGQETFSTVDRINSEATLKLDSQQRIPYHESCVITYFYTYMSRGNVFKLSGNMALGGGGSDYQNVDIDEIKNSLKLLKAKKNRQSGTADSQPNYGGAYGNSYGNSNLKSYTPTRNDYDYDALTKNHLPASQKQFGSDYSKKGYSGSNDYNKYAQPSKNAYKEERNYDYPSNTSKPPSYQQNTNMRAKNTRPEPEKYDSYGQVPSYPKKSNTSKNTASTQGSNVNRPQYKNNNAYDSYDNYPTNTNTNNREERSIREVNRENQVDIVEYDPSELRPCRMGCGRKFNPDSIKKHQANCKKVFQNKRKEFDAQKHRLVDNEQKKLMRKGQQVEKKLEVQKKNQKIPKWKAQSMAFRAGLKQNRNEEVDPREAALVKAAEEQSMVKCPICGRTFNETAGPRHIKFCEEKAKKDGMKKKR